VVVRKLSISLSFELADSIRTLATERAEDVSALIEILLREHPLVARAIQKERERRLDRPNGPPTF
jgi:hypothetical protein